ncbi:MAG TPA: response regulator, partial [Thermoanaerobaculia bacterium]
LKNLLSNAFKFTEEGEVKLRIDKVVSGWTPGHPRLDAASSVIAFAVVDTGIGIAPDKQRVIFEAFQQAEAGTTRRFGGTGLGLSISREIAALLGGQITVRSEPGRGSIFTLYLPETYVAPVEDREAVPEAVAEASRSAAPIPYEDPYTMPRVTEESADTIDPERVPNELSDDRVSIEQGDRTILIVEDDPTFAKILLDLAREKGFKAIAVQGGEAALAMARRYRPDAITLDLSLPDTEGWTVLDRLKHDATTRHIPVHIISAHDPSGRGLRLGAFAHLQKPVTKEALESALAKIKDFVESPTRNLLVSEDDETQRRAIVELIGEGDVEIFAVGSGAEALEAMRSRAFDCVVLDLGLPDMTGRELIQKMKEELHQQPPVIVYTGRELTRREESELQQLAEAIIIKDVRSPDRLLDETALFLHRVESQLPEEKRQMLAQLHQADPILAGRKALIVDDDVRNIYALTSLLERHKMKVAYAESGREGIDTLAKNPDTDVVLMDIMMPEMDGYEAMRQIRSNETWRDLPIIALTAKAMKGDREKCVQAGASDYITKPIDDQQLVSLLRVWLYER